MKKILCYFLMIVLMTCCVMGCGKTPPTPPLDDYEVNVSLPNTTKADLSILIPGGNINEKSMIDKAIAGFNLIYPDINFELGYVAVNSYESTIRNMAAAGSLADIVWTNSPDFYYLVNKNLALNLNPYIEASEKLHILNIGEDFHKEFFDMGSVKGKLYAVPRSVDSVVTFMNTKILKAANVDFNVIKDGWTWDTFMTVCKQVRSYLDKIGKKDTYVLDANLTSWLSVCYPLMRSYGVDVANDQGKVTIDTPAMKECLSMVRQMVTDRIIVDSTMSSGSSFESGTSAFLFQSASISLFANRKELKGNVDLVSFPLCDVKGTPKIGCGIAGYSINSKTKNRDAAWAFINYILSYEGQQQMALGGLNLPSVRKDLQDYLTANWGSGYTDINLNAYLYGMEKKVASDFFLKFDTKYKPALDQAIKDVFNNACNKSKTIDQCMETVIRDINDGLSD